MKSISLKIQEPILFDADNMSSKLETSRNKYINEAIAFYTKYQKRELLKAQIAFESMIVREESLEVCREFEKLDDGLSAI